MDNEKAIIPVHQWTNGGEDVLVLRFVGKDGKSYNGFQHPLVIGESVTAPDWNPAPICGGGIHGWAWGIGMGEGKDPDWDALWQVYACRPEDITGEIEHGQKVKFRTGRLVFLDTWNKAISFVLSGQVAWVAQVARGSASLAASTIGDLAWMYRSRVVEQKATTLRNALCPNRPQQGPFEAAHMVPHRRLRPVYPGQEP